MPLTTEKGGLNMKSLFAVAAVIALALGISGPARATLMSVDFLYEAGVHTITGNALYDDTAGFGCGPSSSWTCYQPSSVDLQYSSEGTITGFTGQHQFLDDPRFILHLGSDTGPFQGLGTTGSVQWMGLGASIPYTVYLNFPIGTNWSPAVRITWTWPNPPTVGGGMLSATNPVPVPEPSTFLLLASGLVGMGAYRSKFVALTT
jgi:hypothetical protein